MDIQWRRVARLRYTDAAHCLVLDATPKGRAKEPRTRFQKTPVVKYRSPWADSDSDEEEETDAVAALPSLGTHDLPKAAGPGECTGLCAVVAADRP